MIATATKGIVQRLYTDSSFRQEFMQTPDQVLASQRLAPEEARALQRLHHALAVTDGSAARQARPALDWP